MYLLSSGNKLKKSENSTLKNKNKKFQIFKSNKKNVFNLNINLGLLFKIIFIISFSLLLILTLGYVSSGKQKTEFIKIDINKGDNLWKIADKYYNDDIDLRKKIFEIKRINNLNTAMIQPGQKLLLPISKNYK